MDIIYCRLFMLIIVCICHCGDILIGMWDLCYIFVFVHFFLQENVGLKNKITFKYLSCGCYNLWQRSQNILFKSCYLLWTILLCFNFYAHISFTVLNKLCFPLSHFLHCFKPDLLLQTTSPLSYFLSSLWCCWCVCTFLFSQGCEYLITECVFFIRKTGV